MPNEAVPNQSDEARDRNPSDRSATSRTILLTNDDGVDAPGLQALRQAMSVLRPRDRVVVVAPDRGRSGCGHGVTDSRPLVVQEVAPECYSVDALPADCVRVALATICPDADTVLSGINAGANLGLDLFVSGTMGAAREAALRGRDAMAISHYRHPDVPRTWDHVARWLGPIMADFFEPIDSGIGVAERMKTSAPAGDIANHSRRPSTEHWGRLWNVNLPAVDPTIEQPKTVVCPVDDRPAWPAATLRDGMYETKMDFHNRPRSRGSDLERCFAGHLTVSHLYPGVPTTTDEA